MCWTSLRQTTPPSGAAGGTRISRPYWKRLGCSSCPTTPGTLVGCRRLIAARQGGRIAQSQRIWATRKSKCGVGPFSFSRKPWFATESLVRRFERCIHLCVCNPAQEPRTTSWQDPERRHPGRLGELEALSLNMNMTQSSGTLLGSISSLLK